MSYPALWRIPPIRLHGLSLALIVATAFVLPGRVHADVPGTPSPHHPGRWSESEAWGATEVHMMLVPGRDSFHSRILWWQHGHDDFQYGGLRGWNPPFSTEEDCEDFPWSFIDLPNGIGSSTYRAGA